MEELEYNEAEAVKFILSGLPKDMKKNIAAKDIEYVLECIFSFYEENNYLEEDNDEIVDIDEEEIFNYVMNQVIQDKKMEKFTEEVIESILEGEYNYCESLGIFDIEED
jgi:hypothetical protein